MITEAWLEAAFALAAELETEPLIVAGRPHGAPRDMTFDERLTTIGTLLVMMLIYTGPACEPEQTLRRVRRWCARASAGPHRSEARPVSIYGATVTRDTLRDSYPAGHETYFKYYGSAARAVRTWRQAGYPPIEERHCG